MSQSPFKLGLPDLVRLERLVRRSATPRHPSTSRDALDAVEDLVALELASAGLRVERHLFTHAGREFHNVLGTRDGTDPSRPWLVVGAHFDSTPHTPGADDNASAVAAMLEVARLLRAWESVATVQYVGFNLEEDRRRFLVTESGIVVIPKGAKVEKNGR